MIQILYNTVQILYTNSVHLARGGERTRDPGRGHPEKGRSCNLVKYHIALLSQQVVKSHWWSEDCHSPVSFGARSWLERADFVATWKLCWAVISSRKTQEYCQSSWFKVDVRQAANLWWLTGCPQRCTLYSINLHLLLQTWESLVAKTYLCLHDQFQSLGSNSSVKSCLESSRIPD